MRTFDVVVGEAGEITLPDDLMAEWDLRPGQDVEFYQDDRGAWYMRPLNASPSAFFEGREARLRVTDGQEDDAIGKAVAERLPRLVQESTAA